MSRITSDGKPTRATVTHLSSEKLPTPPGIPTSPDPRTPDVIYLLMEMRAAFDTLTRLIYAEDDADHLAQLYDQTFDAATILRRTLAKYDA